MSDNNAKTSIKRRLLNLAKKPWAKRLAVIAFELLIIFVYVSGVRGIAEYIRGSVESTALPEMTLYLLGFLIMALCSMILFATLGIAERVHEHLWDRLETWLNRASAATEQEEEDDAHVS